MLYCILAAYFSIVSVNYFTYYVLALNQEDIVGGSLALRKDFNYQVAILGRQNVSNHFSLICGGSIIAENFILSAAHCFLDDSEILTQLTFYIAAATYNIQTTTGIVIKIHIIYTAKYEPTFSQNDIAVAKLEKGLNLTGNPQLSKLQLPKSRQNLYKKPGIVSAYGSHKVKMKFNTQTKEKEIESEKTDQLLRYASVKILKDEECLNYFHEISLNYQFCGSTIPKTLGKPSGVCKGDSGSPLVQNKVIVGIVSRCSYDCDDSHHSAIYTNVSFYVDFIQSIILDRPMKTPIPMYSYYNLPHVRSK